MTKLYPYQKEDVDVLEYLNGLALVASEMGTGKAQPASSKLLTENGWIRMGDVQKGMYIFGSDGCTHKVTGVYPQGIRPVYRVTFSDGTHAECTKDHLWSLSTPNRKHRKKPNIVLPLKAFKADLTIANGNRKYFIPMVKSLKFPKRNLPLDPYFLGILLGDGCLKHSVYVSNPEPDILESIRKILPKEYKLSYCGGCDYRITRPHNHTNTPNVIRSVLQNLNLCVGSKDKFIPKAYKFASKEQRLAILQGLLDTDGYVSRSKGNAAPTVEYTSISKRLCKDVQFLVESFGGRATWSSFIPTFTYKGKKKTGQKAYELYITFPKGIEPFRCKRKKERYKPKAKYQPTRAIVSVEYIGDEECQCISIDSPDNLYVTDHCVLTHNTITLLTYLKNHPELRPAVVVCPATLKWVWEAQAIQHYGMRISILNGRKKIKVGFHNQKGILVINYDILDAWKDYLKSIKPKVVIWDEAHYAKAPRARRTKALKSICKTVPHRIAISGTPLTNRPAELFPTLNMLWPQEFPAFNSFAHRYCSPKWRPWGWDFRGASHIPELHGKLKKLGMIRRLKKDVLKDLPRKSRIIIPMDIQKRSEYTTALNDFIGWLSKTSPTKARRASKAKELVKIGYLVRLAAELKMKAVFEWVDNFFEQSDGKLVLFCCHHSIVDMLHERYKNISVVVTGKVNKNKRQIAIENFQKNPKTKLFIGNIRAAGVGIDLFAANTCGFVEFGFVPGECTQAEDRLHRIGQKKNVSVYFFVAKDTIEETLCKILQNKQRTVTQVLDGKKGRKEIKLDVYNQLLKKIGSEKH